MNARNASLRSGLGAMLFGVLMTTAIHPAYAQSYPRSDSRQVCRDVRVPNRPSDNHRIAGTAIGAVAGGLLGHQVGGGKGKTLATVGGAVAGGYVGNKVQQNHQQENAGYHLERQCHDVRR